MVGFALGDGDGASEPFGHGNFPLEWIIIDNQSVEELDDMVDKPTVAYDKIVGGNSSEVMVFFQWFRWLNVSCQLRRGGEDVLLPGCGRCCWFCCLPCWMDCRRWVGTGVLTSGARRILMSSTSFLLSTGLCG